MLKRDSLHGSCGTFLNPVFQSSKSFEQSIANLQMLLVSAHHSVFAVVCQSSRHPLPKHWFKIPLSCTVFSTKFNDIQELLESIAGLDDPMSGWRGSSQIM